MAVALGRHVRLLVPALVTVYLAVGIGMLPPPGSDAGQWLPIVEQWPTVGGMLVVMIVFLRELRLDRRELRHELAAIRLSVDANTRALGGAPPTTAPAAS